VRRHRSRLGALVFTLTLSAIGFSGSRVASAAGSGWTPLSPSAPPGVATVFDGATGQLLTYDGAKTWSWDGRQWMQVGAPLTLRFSSAMAFDAATNQAIMVGVVGVDTGPSAVMQTWTWNGASWTRQHPTAMPPAEWDACAGYDAAAGQLIMYGGTDVGSPNPGVTTPTPHQETWNWTGSSWVLIPTSTSPPGGSCSMAYDPEVRELVLMTQPDPGERTPPQIWFWDGTTWTQATSGLPTFTDLPSLSYDPEAGGLIAYMDVGHVDPGTAAFVWGGYENETWSWSATGFSMLAVTTPETKMQYGGSVSAFDGSTHQLLLHTDAQFVWGSAIASVESPTRVFGPDRQSTAVAASVAAFPSAGSAPVVVLARADGFADALAGGPLAAANHAPLLLTSSGSLDDVTKAEIERVLKPGGTVYLLGGTTALSASIASWVTATGDTVVRLAGADRFGTALAIANAMGDPSTVFEAGGASYADALSAVPAAVADRGVILLASGSTTSSATANYLRAHPGLHYAVGEPAAAADPSAIALLGADRYATSAAVARAIFPNATGISVASGVNFPDALAAGPIAGLAGQPMLLVPATGSLPEPTSAYLATRDGLVISTRVFGGSAAVADDVMQEITNAMAAS
jgi:hypothetical protein